MNRKSGRKKMEGLDVENETFFRQPLLECARAMLGCELVVNGVSGLIVETEAYSEFGDAACHAFRRLSIRQFIQQRGPGTLYVYLNYGMYWLINFLVKSESGNGFVLVRALEPRRGVDVMQERRGRGKERGLVELCSGPGKLSQALGVRGEFNGVLCGEEIPEGKIELLKRQMVPEVVVDRRIGISCAQEFPWRFLWAGNAFVSRGVTSQ